MEILVEVCQTCGWWRIWRHVTDILSIGDVGSPSKPSVSKARCGAAASLKTLNLGDVTAPLDEVERFLVAKYEKRYQLHPSVFENVVADVFRKTGYRSVVTGRTGDGGVDVILSDGKSEIGVQVKRWKGTIKVEQIRALAGALVLAGLTKGIFVTTSGFQSGAGNTAERYISRGYAIELVDGQCFLEALRLVQKPAYRSLAEFPLDPVLQKIEGQARGWAWLD